MNGAPPTRALRAWHLGLWFVAAVASTMCGIGGGLFAVPILHFLLGLPLQLATATSLVSVFAMTLVGTLAELAQRDSALHWPTLAWLCVGGLVGANLGQWVAKRIDTRALTWVFAVAMLAAGVRILTGSNASHATALVPLSIDGVHAAGIVAIGFAGGFVAPLLGVGGGLIVVPALFLGVPGMSYLGARACSTAMSVVNSAQLTLLNLREDRVHRPVILPFALVAAVGAVVGILLVHRPGWPEAARILLGVVLLGVGANFARRGMSERRLA